MVLFSIAAFIQHATLHLGISAYFKESFRYGWAFLGDTKASDVIYKEAKCVRDPKNVECFYIFINNLVNGIIMKHLS